MTAASAQSKGTSRAKSSTRPEPFASGIARAFGGALFFAFPLLMTMEMWEAGLSMDRVRLTLFVLACLPLILGLCYFAGFRRAQGFHNALPDALIAVAVGFVLSGSLLGLFGLLDSSQSLSAQVGMITLQAMPAAIGAALARKQLKGGRNDPGEDDDPDSYSGQLFLMAAGALFVAFNVAPTEEVILISYKMSPWQTAGLMALSLLLLNTIVYHLGFAGQKTHEPGSTAFLHYTVPGYGIALAVSLFVLWAFGRTDGIALAEAVSAMVVLGFPAALGAALARLVV